MVGRALVHGVHVLIARRAHGHAHVRRAPSSILRAVSTSSVETLCTVVNLACRAVDRDYVEPLQHKLQRSFGSLDTRDLRNGYMVCLPRLARGGGSGGNGEG